MSVFKTDQGKGVDVCISWVKASGGEIPDGAIPVGDGRYIGRSVHNGEYCPGKVADGYSSCFYPWGGEEHECNDYQVLVDSCNIGLGGQGYQWVSWSGNGIPKGAVIAGTNNGRPLYVARGEIDGEMCAGKFLPDMGMAWFAYGGQEHEVTSGYEILVACTRSG